VDSQTDRQANESEQITASKAHLVLHIEIGSGGYELGDCVDTANTHSDVQSSATPLSVEEKKSLINNHNNALASYHTKPSSTKDNNNMQQQQR
jgi:hypothetical protein